MKKNKVVIILIVILSVIVVGIVFFANKLRPQNSAEKIVPQIQFVGNSPNGELPVPGPNDKPH